MEPLNGWQVVSPYPAGQSHEARISPPLRHVGSADWSAVGSADWSAVHGGSHSGRRLGLCLALGGKIFSLYRYSLFKKK